MFGKNCNIVGSLKAVERELSKYKLNCVRHEVGWDKGGTDPVDVYKYFYGNWKENHELGTGFFVH
jgi:hypothetical protein